MPVIFRSRLTHNFTISWNAFAVAPCSGAPAPRGSGMFHVLVSFESLSWSSRILSIALSFCASSTNCFAFCSYISRRLHSLPWRSASASLSWSRAGSCERGAFMTRPHASGHTISLVWCYGKCNIAHFCKRRSLFMGLGAKICRFCRWKFSSRRQWAAILIHIRYGAHVTPCFERAARSRRHSENHTIDRPARQENVVFLKRRAAPCLTRK